MADKISLPTTYHHLFVVGKYIQMCASSSSLVPCCRVADSSRRQAQLSVLLLLIPQLDLRLDVQRHRREISWFSLDAKAAPCCHLTWDNRGMHSIRPCIFILHCVMGVLEPMGMHDIKNPEFGFNTIFVLPVFKQMEKKLMSFHL